jgi:hypothetical protein
MIHNHSDPGDLDAFGRDLSVPVASTGGGIRTHTGVTPRGILSPLQVRTQTQSWKETKVPSKVALPLPCPTDPAELSPDLALVVAAWPSLPEAIRAGILAMVKAVSECR